MQFDWQNIDTVLLDMDGTLLDLHFDNYFWLTHMPQQWAAKEGVSYDTAREKLDPIFRYHAGTLNWYCVDFWSDTLGLDIMTLKEQVANKISYRPGAERFLQTCKQQTGDVRMVTNGHRKVLDLKIRHVGIDQYFDSMLCSHELDKPKENPAFWESLQAEQHFDPERTLFIDDNDAVLSSAEQFGIAHLYSIEQPDSSRDRSSPSRFVMLPDFD